MTNVCVCGAAGGIGQPLSLLLMKSLPAGSTLSLYDIAGTAGVAADLSHIDTAIRVVHATGSVPIVPNDPALLALAKGVNVFVILAGVPRKPGMSRDDLFNVNAGICHDLVSTVAKVAPNAFFLIVTNPVNSTVPIAAAVLKRVGCYDKNRLFGVSLLDVVRATKFVNTSSGIAAPVPIVPVVGGHSDVTIVPILSQVAGLRLSDAEAQAIISRVQTAGTEVVNAKAGKGSATLSMAEAGARFTMLVVNALLGKPTPVTYAYVDTDGTTQAPFECIPVQLGPKGIAKRLPIGAMNAFETQIHQKAVETVKKNIEKGEAFARARL